MAKFEIDVDGKVLFTDGNNGAIMLEDEMWHPFCYFNNGDYDISDISKGRGFTKPSEAFKQAKLNFT